MNTLIRSIADQKFFHREVGLKNKAFCIYSSVLLLSPFYLKKMFLNSKKNISTAISTVEYFCFIKKEQQEQTWNLYNDT